MRTPDILRRLSPPASAKPVGSMNLIAREGTVRDIPEWLELHRSLGIPYSKPEWITLPAMGKGLLSTGGLKLFLVEDRLKSRGLRIVSCCAAVFATDKFCAEACSVSPPYLSIQLVRRYRSRDPGILSRSEIVHANTKDGLNLVICFEGPERSALLGEQYLMLYEKRCEAFELAIAGYRIKEFLANPVGEQAYQEMLDAGARLRRNCFTVDTNGARLHKLCPRLVGLTKEEAEAHPGSYLSKFFVSNPPRFHFSQAEQRLLDHALMGETCEDLAASLLISLWTVKKRWRVIYDRVTDVDRELLPPSIACSAHVSSRGAERRRRLLTYLRQHPEELRPWRPNSSG